MILGVLALMESFWRLGTACADRTASRTCLDVPVLGISSLTVGGGGKTPLVRLLSSQFRLRGYRPSIITRGYGGSAAGPIRVDWKCHGSDIVGDEALVLASGLSPEIPIIVSRNRLAGARLARKEYRSNLILLDDALMQRRIRMDCEVAVQGTDGLFGNGRCLPAGPLRRPLSLLERMAALVLIKETDQPLDPLESNLLMAANTPLYHADLKAGTLYRRPGGETAELKELFSKRVVAWAGIARPWRFAALLTSLGASVLHFESFPDHHRYCADDIARLKQLIDATHGTPITTVKDAVRWPRDSDIQPYVLDIDLSISELESMVKMITRRFGGENLG